MPNQASINLVFASFVANANAAPANGAPGGPYCAISSLAFKDGLDADGQVTIENNNKIRIRRPSSNSNSPIFITFNISCTADSINYNPKAIVFVQGNNGTSDPSGNNNFPGANRNPLNQSITIKDMVADKNGAVWKFYIQIQQMNPAPAPQPMGWIDPDIQNDA